MSAGDFYNDVDRDSCAWMRELIARGALPAGDVVERSITHLQAADMRRYRRAHFFAGVGGWAHAVQLSRRARRLGERGAVIWTGSCPCQPFSVAGQRRGVDDERHLWPAWFDLIRVCRPSVVVGEQVAGRAGLAWLDAVFADLEGAGYACAAADLPAAGVGAPHRRQRLYWMAYRHDDGREIVGQARVHGAGQQRDDAARRGADGGVGDAAGSGPQGGEQPGQRTDAQLAAAERAGAADAGTVAHAYGSRPEEQSREWLEPEGSSSAGLADDWRDIQWLECTDGKARPAQRGILPLADGLPTDLVRGGDRRLAPDASAEARAMRLRGYGNAIVPALAAAFLEAALYLHGQTVADEVEEARW